MPNVASITIAMIETRTITALIAALHVLVERLGCISPALPSRGTTSEMPNPEIVTLLHKKQSSMRPWERLPESEPRTVGGGWERCSCPCKAGSSRRAPRAAADQEAD